MSQETDLGIEPVGRLLFRLAVPAILAQLVNMLYNIVDRIYIGHIPKVGATALTGVGVTFPILMLIAACSALVGMGGAPRASIKMGEGNYPAAENILGNCFTVLMLMSVILTVGFLLSNRSLLLLFGASEQTLEYGLQYIQIYVLGTVFVQLALGLNSFISSQGFAKISMLTVMIGAAFNIVLDPIFIFTLNMGVQGAAVATVISQGVSAIWVLWFLFGKQTKLKLQPRYFRLEWGILLPVISLGVSPFIMQSTESLLTICFNSSLQRYGGDLAVGAMTIMTSIMQFVNMPLMGLTQGAQPIMGFNFGAKQMDRVKRTFIYLLISCVVYSVSLWLVIMIIPQWLVSMFVDTKELLDISVWASGIYFAVVFLMGVQLACQQTFISIGQAKISLFLALLRKVILLIPLIYLLPQLLEDKVFAVFLAEPIADLIAVSVTATLFFVQFRKILQQKQ